MEFTAEAVMAAGYKRIKSIADRHGINSPEVLAACERWGGILDDVNYPDTTCRNCGHPVTFITRYQHYVHTDRSDGAGDRAAKWCKTVAAAIAQPIDKAKVYSTLYGNRDAEISNSEIEWIKQRAEQVQAEGGRIDLKPMAQPYIMGSTSGRMSQTKPDLKNIPKPRKLRDNPQG